jgi:L-alanine-DL-glutamate epimerase-like enolase superfamily enzyme
MAHVASSYAPAPRLKLKLTGTGEDVERVRAVRGARPEAWIGVDANQGWTRHSLEALLPALVELEVKLIEQPLPAGRDAELRGLHSPIPLAADESVQSLADLTRVEGIFDVVNIKLDKCGGLTEALEMAREIRRLGMTPMVGCMSATTLAIAPACVVGELCDLVDLDAPLFLASDRAPSASYRDGMIQCPEDWGFIDPCTRGASGRALPSR